MDEFGDGHNGEADLDFTLRSVHLFEDLPDRVASALGGDDDAGVEDYSHDGGFQGLPVAASASEMRITCLATR